MSIRYLYFLLARALSHLRGELEGQRLVAQAMGELLCWEKPYKEV